jgi:gliding motility-associated-like protein
MKRVHPLFRKSFLSGICIFIFSIKLSSQCINTFPYSEGFETASTWTLSGPNSDWALGAPAHPTINSAGGGTKSWCVGGLTGSFYNNAEQAAIVSPCFDLTNLSYPWISFKIFWECEFNYDGLVLQYTTNNGSTWTNVGAFGDPNDCNTANWFNHNNISKLTSITTRHGWSGRIGTSASGCSGGNGSGGWVTAKHCLTGLANLTNVRFRFLFGSGTTCNNFDGVAIDDIVISNGIPNVANFNFTCNGAGNYNFNAVTAPCPAPGTFDWNFGDPSSGASNISTVQNSSHVFSAPGTYTVSLIVKGGQCNPPDTITQTVIVSNVSNPVAQDITCFGLNNGSASVVVTGANPISYNWLPSGGNSVSATNLSAGNYSVIITDVNNCSYTKTISITEPSVLTSTVLLSNTSCGLANGSATASASGGSGSYSYAWSPTGGNSSVASGLLIGNYTITITDANNCSVIKSINLGQAPSLSLSVNSLTLCNNQTGNLTANVVGGTLPYSYNWNGTITASGSLPVVGGATISYPVLVTDANGCISNPDTAKLFAVAPLVINVSPDDTICSGGKTTLFVNASGGNGNYSYAWQPNGSNASSFTISATTPQVYNVTVNDGCGSSQTGTVSVNIYSVPASSLIASQTSGCQPLCVTFSDPALITSGIITNWNWNFGDSTSASSNSNHCYDKSGTFSVKILYTTNKGCTGTQTINNYIKVFPKPKAEFSASTFETDVYNTTIEFYNQTQNASYYNWSFEAGAFSGQQNPTYTFMHEGHYKVFLAAENTYGCVDTISKDVYIIPDFTFYAPNAFTPNGDGLNDRFFSKGAGWDPAKYELYVFDRWGEKIFQTKDPLEGWDGRVNGKGEIVETGVYVWKVLITDVFKKEHHFTGHCTLIK